MSGELAQVIYRAATVHAQAGVPVEAFAVAAQRVWAIGSLDALRERCPGADVRDFGDATIVPGFNDAHTHLAIAAENALHLDLSHAAVSTRDGLLERVRTAASATSPGGWVRGSRYDDAKTGVVTRDDLDSAAGPVPTLVLHVASHWAVANSAALQAFGYRDDSVPPSGGAFGRDSTGRLDGKLIERALLDVAYPATGRTASPLPVSTRADRLVGLRRVLTEWHAAGLTSACDALVGPDDIELLQAARRAGELSLRTGFLLSAEHYDKARQLGIGSGFGDDWLRFVGVKAFVDGAIGGRTCLLREPFVGTDDRGQQITSTSELREIVTQVHRDGNRIGVHANGDAAIRLLLSIYADVAREFPVSGLRHRIEHCSVVDDEIVERIRALAAIVVPFAGYVAYYGAALDDWYGAKRTAAMFAHRSFLDAGITVAGSSDYPCGPFEPLVGVQSMVTRKGLTDGALVGANQRVSPAEALQIFTVGSAVASGDEQRKGRLAPGYLADFVVLAADPLAVEPDSISAIPVRETYVGGRRVWPAA